jgi:hypothetical protein
VFPKNSAAADIATALDSGVKSLSEETAAIAAANRLRNSEKRAKIDTDAVRKSLQY